MTEKGALVLASASAIFFGTALVTAKLGLRTMDARAGAAISIPTATVLLALAAPFALDASAFSVAAALVFALVGVFFPALVTLIVVNASIGRPAIARIAARKSLPSRLPMIQEIARSFAGGNP